MSLSSSISNAISGLTVSARRAQLVSTNLANAMNENYARRELDVVAEGNARNGGVRIVGVSRFVDPVVIADRRNAGAAVGLASTRSEAAQSLMNIAGVPDDPNSISAHLRRFEASLGFAESDPSSTIRLSDVVSTASDLVNALGGAEDKISQLRTQADAKIDRAVTKLNTELQQVADLNESIVAAKFKGQDASSLLDHRQAIIDSISEMVPVREMQRDHGAVSLVTTKGFVLLDHNPVTLDFTPSNSAEPHMKVDNGLLGALSSDGIDFDMSQKNGVMSGGALQGLFQIRDELGVQAQAQIDGFALELAMRASTNGADSTIAPGAPGLFTDGGTLAESANETGLAGRLQLHAGVDPTQGGDVWRIRSGVGAALPNSAGESSIISGLVAGLSSTQTPVSSAFATAGSLFDHSASVSSRLAQTSARASAQQGFASAHFNQFNALYLADGVDTDAELQKLLAVETNYAANAKVLQTIDEMLNDLMRIT